MTGILIGGPGDGRAVPAGQHWQWMLKPAMAPFGAAFMDSSAIMATEFKTVRGEYREVRKGMYVWCGWEGERREPVEHTTRIRLDDHMDQAWAEEKFRRDVEAQAAERYMAVAWQTLTDEVMTSTEPRSLRGAPITERRWSWRRWRWEDVETGEYHDPILDFVDYRVLRVFSYPKEH